MSLFDLIPEGLQNLAGGASDAAQGAVDEATQAIGEGGLGDVAQNVTDQGSQIAQDAQEGAGNVIDNIPGFGE